MSGATTLSPEIAGAIDEIKATFGDNCVAVTPDTAGAWVEIDSIDLGSKWAPGSTWLAFHIASTYPYADVYPLFIDATCALTTGGLPPAVTAGAVVPIREGPCLQVSRKSNRWDPTRDTATGKALKVIDWLRSA
ncbi:MAG: hypothetical protein JNK12_09020 [Acidimicrobiales bacterium]|nr:hypothetical protein [Acidimicrobiales bacterium]